MANPLFSLNENILCDKNYAYQDKIFLEIYLNTKVKLPFQVDTL